MLFTTKGSNKSPSVIIQQPSITAAGLASPYLGAEEAPALQPLPLCHDSCTASWFSEQPQLLALPVPPVPPLLGDNLCFQIIRKGNTHP